jgi:hypothetical protein
MLFYQGEIVMRILSKRQVKELVLYSPQHTARLEKAGLFPKGAMIATGSAVMNPFAGGGQNNLYRCFIDLSFRQVAPEGYAALIHQDGHLKEDRAVSFRQAWYRRITKHFDFSNKITSKNFAEVKDTKRFSLNVYRGQDTKIEFQQFTNAMLASQVEESFRHDGTGPIPAIKDENGNWITSGHRDRITSISQSDLTVFRDLTGETGSPVDATRLVQLHSPVVLDAIKILADKPSIKSSGSDYQLEAIHHESGAQTNGTIERNVAFPINERFAIYSGPSLFVGNPLSKTPRNRCRHSQDYEVIDLVTAGNNYLPRSIFQAVDKEGYMQRLPACDWNPTISHVDNYRLAFRRRIDLNSERSFTGAIIPKGVAHIDGIQSVAFRSEDELLNLSALLTSIPFDFLFKVLGKGDIYSSDFMAIPWVKVSKTAKHRTLRLASLTAPYADLWNGHASRLEPLRWHSEESRLTIEGPFHGPSKWDRTAALRNDYARRMALVEIDVLVAQALGLTLSQLIDIYRIYFPVLQQNEAGTWYDQNGRIAWTCTTGMTGVGYLEDGKSPSRKNWEKIIEDGRTHLECQAVVDFMPGGPQTITRTFEGPFDTCDRVEDYKRAWTYFEAHKAAEDAA